MATARNFSMLGINSGHDNLPTYEMSLKSDNVEFVRYCLIYFLNLLSVAGLGDSIIVKIIIISC
jgi:hypothetical protein